MSDVVPVVQADRDLLKSLMALPGNDDILCEHIDLGLAYTGEVEEIARHRIAETARLEAEIERLRGAGKTLLEWWPEGSGNSRVGQLKGEGFAADLEAFRTALAADTGEG